MTANEVVHLDHAVHGHLEADGPVRGAFQKPFHFLLRKSEGVAQARAGSGVVHERLSGGLGGSALLSKFIGRIKRVIGPAGSHQLFRVLAVDGTALALAVRGMRMLGRCLLHHFAIPVHTLVRDDAAPVQGLDDVLLCAGHKAVGVRVFDTDDEVSSLLLGIEVIIQGRTYTAHVKRSGG